VLSGTALSGDDIDVSRVDEGDAITVDVRIAQYLAWTFSMREWREHQGHDG
jgi:hypothetical protein